MYTAYSVLPIDVGQMLTVDNFDLKRK